MNGWDEVANMEGNDDDYDTHPESWVMNALWHDGNVVILYIATLFLFTEIGYVETPWSSARIGYITISAEMVLKN